MNHFSFRKKIRDIENMKLALCFVVLVCACVCHAGHGREENSDNDRLLEHSQKAQILPRRVKRSFHEVVAFDVIYYGDPIRIPKGHHLRVPYNIVHLNIGDGYNLGLHAFIAPRAGLYKFDVHGFPETGPGCLDLRKNGGWTATTHTQYGKTHMGITRLLTLRKGDSVFVTSCSYTSSTIDKWHKNSFTGFLLA